MQIAKLIGSNPLVTNYTYSCNFLNLNSIYAQSLRWKRKPIWLPTAKTKVFRVPKRPEVPKEEAVEIQRLYNNYRTYLRSVRFYFKEVYEKNKVELDEALIDKEEEEDYQRCFIINEEWNKKIAAEREKALNEQREARKLHILKRKELKKETMEKIKAEVDMKVRKVKLEAPTFITRENIDKAIEEALENVVDYNKALELDGTWYTDKSGLVIKKAVEQVSAKQ